MNAGWAQGREKSGWIRPVFVTAVALVLIAAGCGRGGTETAPTDEGAVEPQATEEAAPETAPMQEGAIQEETLPPEAAAPGRKTASARIEPRSGSSLSGTAVFEESAEGVHMVLELSGASPGEHGVHVHETGDCSADDASSAGGHFNPGGMAHGAPGTAAHHAGDFGNITIGADGTGSLHFMTKSVTLADGPTGIVGRALVVHADPDDLTSQPSGNAGARIGCGVIE